MDIGLLGHYSPISLLGLWELLFLVALSIVSAIRKQLISLC